MALIIRLFERADQSSTQTNTALTQLPESVLSTTGALAPPAGVTANFVNPDSIRGVLIATSSVGIAVLIICVDIRAWTIFKLLGKPIKWAWSDVTFTFGALFSSATFITLILTTTATGQVGVHQWDAPLSRIFVCIHVKVTLAEFNLVCCAQSLCHLVVNGSIPLSFFSNIIQ
ncbi:hypothetical protein EAF04_005514 [Stromatinia cepivora]|nr:hypothetical protein EAF04_005514 [Stromatinia cepivora]